MLKTLFSVGQKNMYVANYDLNTVYAMNPINKTQIISCLANLKNCKTNGHA